MTYMITHAPVLACRYCDGPIEERNAFWMQHVDTKEVRCNPAAGELSCVARVSYDETGLLTMEQVLRIERVHRIPVDDMYGPQGWHACLSTESLMPSDFELAQLRSAIEFSVRKTFKQHHTQRMLDQLLAYDPGANTLVLCKGIRGKHTGWHYRRASWEIGASLVPSPMSENFAPFTLVQVLDQVFDLTSAAWDDHKQTNPHIFKEQ